MFSFSSNQLKSPCGSPTVLNTNSKNPNASFNSVSGGEVCAAVATDNSGNIFCAGFTYSDMTQDLKTHFLFQAYLQEVFQVLS